MNKTLRVLLLALPFLGLACADSQSNMGPATAFETSYQLALEGKYDQTADYFSDSVLTYLKNNPDMTLQKVWAARLNDGAVKGIKIIERHTDEKNCDIQFMLLGDGGMTDAEDTLVFEKGMWKFDKLKRVR
ncbi:MAG TPA: hypothetical protein VHE12_03815 [bacterium]|nr:hypothetical protein [bacterium]